MRFVKIAQIDKNEYMVLSKKGMFLGDIKYFKEWHKFIFIPEYETFYDILCMIEIGEYMGSLKKK